MCAVFEDRGYPLSTLNYTVYVIQITYTQDNKEQTSNTNHPQWISWLGTPRQGHIRGNFKLVDW